VIDDDLVAAAVPIVVTLCFAGLLFYGWMHGYLP
jgi:hypothetical protein